MGRSRAVEKKPHERMDYVGAVIFAAALALFVLRMSLGPASAWSNPWDYAMILGLLILAGVFAFAQQRVREPLVDFNLFRVPGEAGYVWVFLPGSAISPSSCSSPSTCRASSPRSPSTSPSSWCPLRSRPCARQRSPAGWPGRCPSAVLTSLGMVCIGVAPLSLIVLIQYDAVLAFGYLSFACMGLGIGLFMTPNTSSIMALSPPARRGISNAVRSTMLNLSMLMTNAIGLALSTMFLPQSGRTAVYAGEFPVLGAHAGAFTTGIQVALGVMGSAPLPGSLCACVEKTSRRIRRGRKPAIQWTAGPTAGRTAAPPSEREPSGRRRSDSWKA